MGSSFSKWDSVYRDNFRRKGLTQQLGFKGDVAARVLGYVVEQDHQSKKCPKSKLVKCIPM